MSTYSGGAFVAKFSKYLTYRGSATAAALNLARPKIGDVYDITDGGTLTDGNITVQAGDAVLYLSNGWIHCNNNGADQAIAELSSQFEQLLEEIGGTDFSQFALKTEIPDVPTTTSELTNDANFGSLADILVDGKVIIWNNTTQKLETATTDQLRNLLMWIGTETELRTLVSNSGLEEGKLYATLDNSYFS